MKNFFRLLIFPVLFFSCAPATEITGSWKTQKPITRSYQKILVSVLSSEVVTRARLESDIAMSLSKHGVTAIKSIDEFPPSLKNDSLDKETIMYNVKKNESDGILTVAILKKETQTRYVPGNYPYPVGRFGFYGNFWDYYSNWYPYAYSTGYYDRDHVYYLETNLYDSRTEDLIWSAQSETYDPANLSAFSKEFSEIITARMQKEGVLNIPLQAKK
jgi:hypothetical protein